MKIIEVSGKSANGKDTIATLLKKQFEKYGQRVAIVHFGDPVKWLAGAYMGYKGVKDKEDREILQRLGTTIMRGYKDTFWADFIGQFIAAISHYDMFDVILIPDLRFKSEHATIRKYCLEERLELFTIRINRINPDGTPYKNPNMTEEQLNHISECELDDFPTDFIINNNSQPETVEQAAHMIMRQILPNYKEFDNLEN